MTTSRYKSSEDDEPKTRAQRRGERKIARVPIGRRELMALPTVSNEREARDRGAGFKFRRLFSALGRDEWYIGVVTEGGIEYNPVHVLEPTSED